METHHIYKSRLEQIEHEFRMRYEYLGLNLNDVVDALALIRVAQKSFGEGMPKRILAATSCWARAYQNHNNFLEMATQERELCRKIAAHQASYLITLITSLMTPDVSGDPLTENNLNSVYNFKDTLLAIEDEIKEREERKERRHPRNWFKNIKHLIPTKLEIHIHQNKS